MVLKKTTVLEGEGTENEVSCLCLLLPPHVKPLKKTWLLGLSKREEPS